MNRHISKIKHRTSTIIISFKLLFIIKAIDCVILSLIFFRFLSFSLSVIVSHGYLSRIDIQNVWLCLIQFDRIRIQNQYDEVFIRWQQHRLLHNDDQQQQEMLVVNRRIIHRNDQQRFQLVKHRLFLAKLLICCCVFSFNNLRRFRSIILANVNDLHPNK